MIVLPETRERLEQYFRSPREGQPDFVPILAQINEHVVKLWGRKMREAYTHAEKFVEMNLGVFQYYRLDLPGFYYDIYNIEAEALGQRMNWEANRMPDIDRQNPLIRETLGPGSSSPAGFSGNRPACPSCWRSCAGVMTWVFPCGSGSVPPSRWP